MLTLLLPLGMALAACFAIEAATVEPGHPRGRSPGVLAGRAVVYALLFTFWFQFSWRPWLACASTALTLVVFAVISHLKKRVIGEPLVFSDFALLRQVPRHPELYYTRPPTDPRVFGPALAGVAVVVAWYALEPTALPASRPAAILLAVLLPLALAALVLAADGRTALGAALAGLAPRPDLRRDVGRWGLAPTLALYALRWRRERREAPSAPAEPPPRPRAAPRDGRGDPPVIVVAQLESFLDPVRLGGPPLPMLERVRARAWQYGRLRVPAHGAYTMRTEHAVLTGREEEELGFARFDPYLSLGGRLPDALPRVAAGAGFESVFVHPFAESFFDRAAIVRAMGFERLVMEEAFADAERRGRYVADSAVAARILAEARGDRAPLLVFTVTMENHGPWRPGRLPGIDVPLDQYLHHVGHAGAAVEALLDGLAVRASCACTGTTRPRCPPARRASASRRRTTRSFPSTAAGRAPRGRSRCPRRRSGASCAASSPRPLPSGGAPPPAGSRHSRDPMLREDRAVVRLTVPRAIRPLKASQHFGG